MNPVAKSHFKINKPVAEVFSAVVDKHKIDKYFVSSATGDMVEGTSIMWRWDEFNAEGEVKVGKIVENKSIAFQWHGGGFDFWTNVLLTFDTICDGTATVFRAEESGWPADQQGIDAAVGQTEGWAHMILCCKTYLEHGISLRAGGVRG